MIRIVTILAILAFTTCMSAQEVVIKGNAPSYAHDRLVFKTFSDYITGSLKTLDSVEINGEGEFVCRFSSASTIKVFCEKGVYRVILYVEPGKEYTIKLPEKKEKTRVQEMNPYFQHTQVYPGILNADKNELNLLIRDFENIFSDYANPRYLLYVYRKGRKSGVDSLIQHIDAAFAGASHPYFTVYKKYKYALLKHLAYIRDTKFMTHKYFTYEPIKYNNDAYMELFCQLYHDYLNYYKKSAEGAQVLTDIAHAKSFKDLMFTLKKNTALANDTLRELVILKGLHDAFYERKTTDSREFPVPQLLQTLDSARMEASTAMNREIAENIKNKVTRLLEGTKAPDFALYDMDSSLVTLSGLAGKYVYLDFSAAWNFTCTQELELLKKLHKKYGKYITFVTVFTDDDTTVLNDYLQENEFPWTILHYGAQPEILKQYNIRAYPTYYLIDSEGRLAMSPAEAPSEDMEYYLFRIAKEQIDGEE